jgi:alkyl hydroperoxide reductase subunit AhpF
MGPMLEIYIERGCTTCLHAVQLADQIQSEMPRVSVKLIDLANPGAFRPDSIFAVPTYLINGKTFSLGNPAPEDLVRELQGHMS